MIWWKKKEPPAPLAHYLAHTFRSWTRTRLIQDSSFIVLDSETTGFDLQHDRMVSLAWVKVSDYKLYLNTARSHVIFHPSLDLKESPAIHGLLSTEIDQGTPELEVLQSLIPDITNTIIVGHHIQFDIRMLNQAMQRHFQVHLRNPILDTAHLAMRTLDAFRKTGYGNQRPPSLDEVCAHVNLPIENRHTAEGDTLATAELLLIMLARLKSKLNREPILKDLPIQKS